MRHIYIYIYYTYMPDAYIWICLKIMYPIVSRKFDGFSLFFPSNLNSMFWDVLGYSTFSDTPIYGCDISIYSKSENVGYPIHNSGSILISTHL